MISVDPGIGGTGVAIWDPTYPKPAYTKVIRPLPNLEWMANSEHISKEFLNLLKTYEYLVDEVYIEWPGLHQTAAGMASAARGDIFKLMFLVGALTQQCWTNNWIMVAVPVAQWKGQMSKEAVAKRVATKLGCQPDAYPNHVMDAVGIGLAVRGNWTIR